MRSCFFFFFFFAAAKYKTYGRLRALEATTGNRDGTKTPSKSDLQRAKAKRKYAVLSGADAGRESYDRARAGVFTPSKDDRSPPAHPSNLDPYDSPTVFRRLFSPTTHRQTQSSPLPLKTVIGPTPQRDGQALGLFDLLSASGGSTATPSTKRVASFAKDANRTPSGKRKMSAIEEEEDDDDPINIRMGRTPASSSKKLYLEKLFATPTTLRFATMVEDEESAFHRSRAAAEVIPEVHPLGSETPSFLRRSNSGRFLNNRTTARAGELSPVAIRKPRRFVGKGLSAIVQGLRDMEDERMQEDWEVMRELEEEQAQHAAEAEGLVQVGDSQAPGADGNGNGNGNGTGRVWKKRGQKRTTRLVKMKPVISKAKPPSTAPQQRQQPDEQEDEEESEDELLANAIPLPESSSEVEDDQHLAPSEANSDASFNEPEPEPEPEPGTTSTRPPQPPPSSVPRKPSSFSEKIKAAISSVVKPSKPVPISTNNANTKTASRSKPHPSKDAKRDDDDATATKKRKINPEAHANYRSLKIRNRGGGGAGGRRFGRRR
jgi:hypothetical protein